MPTGTYALTATTDLPFAETAERVRAELAADGFGVLCEFDLSAVDAERMLSIVGNDELGEVADEVRRRLASVVERAVR
jgi:uncharacterized protein (DUF302 family)